MLLANCLAAIDTVVHFLYSNCMGFIKKAIDFLARPSHSRTMGLVVMLVLVAAVSLTIIVSQQQQQTKQRASAVCEDSSIQECPTGVTLSDLNCVVQPKLKCKITKGDKYEVWGCQ